MRVQAYIDFDGRADEAIELYQRVGAKLGSVVRGKEHPSPADLPPGLEDKVMHGEMTIGETLIYFTDGCGKNDPGFKGISLCLTADSEQDAHRIFDVLAEGGKVEMPLAKTFFSPCFGSLNDRFGVNWMIIVQG